MKIVNRLRAALLPLALVAAAPLAGAQTFVKGKVVDPAGAGVGGVDLDLIKSDGSQAKLRNDGTATDGTYKTEVRDGPGTYDVRFSPPFLSPLLPLVVPGVFVVGTKDLGTRTLTAGHLVKGRCVDANGAALADVQLSVLDAAGAPFFIAHAATDATGAWAFAVPDGSWTIQFDPSLLAGPRLAPVQREAADVVADLDLGDVTIPPGFLLSATCRRTNGTAIAGLDVDVLDSATRRKLWTPGDKSDALGFVDVVVPSGTYDVQLEPLVADKLVAQELMGTTVGAADLGLGTITFQAGLWLSGTITAAATGAPVFDADVDVIDPITGFHWFLGNDNSDASGFYRVVVPAGVFDVDFEAPTTLALASKTIGSVSVGADTTRNVALDACPADVHYGAGVAGSGGFLPTLASVGDPARLGAASYAIRIANGLGGATAFFTLGLDAASLPFKSGFLLVDPASSLYLLVALPLDGAAGAPGAGSFDLVDSVPDDTALDGVHVYLQALVVDPGAPRKVAMSDGLDVTLVR